MGQKSLPISRSKFRTRPSFSNIHDRKGELKVSAVKKKKQEEKGIQGKAESDIGGGGAWIGAAGVVAGMVSLGVAAVGMMMLGIMVAGSVAGSGISSGGGSPCRNSCGNIPINYPFGIDEGCGSPQFRKMLNCSLPDLFFLTPSGAYKVQRIDYPRKQVVVYDPAMSTCSILQPHHDLILTDIQSAIIPPSSDTVFALLNCSLDSPVLNHYRNLCFNFSGHSCDELYSPCNAFRVFRLLTNSSPPCCFTSYDTVRFMSMNILDCSHYTTVINTDSLRGVGPLDWVYGIKLSYSVPETGCGRCALSGGTCGFDSETLASQCLCSPSSNATRECGSGSVMASNSDPATKHQPRQWTALLHLLLLLSIVHQLCSW